MLQQVKLIKKLASPSLSKKQVAITRRLYARDPSSSSNYDFPTPLTTPPNKPVKLFDKILIANRGEIACRVIRTANKLGIKTVAVYSTADKHSQHVKLASEAYCIGEPESAKSYLRQETIIDVAKKSGAQAIHPGYGFLSENAGFAQKCEKQGITFIGPPPYSIHAMGSKSESKNLMQAAKVPVVPGYHGTNQDDAFLLEEAKKIGFPVLIKAVMGGGGKGMKIVKHEGEFLELLTSARREAKGHFSDENVLLEKYITRPRHIEFQVFGDKYGNYVYLFERDCSVQRRHQKVIEEAPSPGLTPELRKKMGESAVDAARAVGYVGAGTVEFIVDQDDNNNYYFMEMNTRLQVEHPVTEMITNQDLVEWQIRVASGDTLPLSQDQLKLNGHSFEARIYAEDPDNNFLPMTGNLRYLRPPTAVEGRVRVETGVVQGDSVSIYYDPMISKLVVWGEDRSAGLRLLKQCLDDYHIAGLKTNIEFLKRLATHPEFIAANVETHFIQKHTDTLLAPATSQKTIDDSVLVLGTIAIALQDKRAYIQQQQKNTDDVYSPFTYLFGTRLNEKLKRDIKYNEATDRTVSLTIEGPSIFTASIGSQQYTVTDSTLIPQDNSTNCSSFTLKTYINDKKYDATVVFNLEETGERLYIFTHENGTKFELTPVQAKILGGAHGTTHETGNTIKSPMFGKLVQKKVKVGDTVKKGQTVFVIEAMKMENSIAAPRDGKVTQVYGGAEGSVVQTGTVLLTFE